MRHAESRLTLSSLKVMEKTGKGHSFGYVHPKQSLSTNNYWAENVTSVTKRGFHCLLIFLLLNMLIKEHI